MGWRKKEEEEEEKIFRGGEQDRDGGTRGFVEFVCLIQFSYFSKLYNVFLAIGCSWRPDWANGSHSATILALGTSISPKLPIPKASQLGPLSMCRAIKRNGFGYKTSAHVPKPHRTTDPGLFRVKNLPFTPTSPPWMLRFLVLQPHVPGAVTNGLCWIISRREIPNLPSQAAFPSSQICCCHPGVN